MSLFAWLIYRGKKWHCVGNTKNARWYLAGARKLGLTIRTGRPRPPDWCYTPQSQLRGLMGVYILAKDADKESMLVNAAFEAEAGAHPGRGYNYESSI